MHGQFSCQNCNITTTSCRFYPKKLEITWKCKHCDEVSTVSIYKEKGY